MSGYELALLSARIGDTLHEGRDVLDQDEFESLLVMVSTVVSRLVADILEQRHMEGW